MSSIRIVDKKGNIFYKNEDGDFHREDGPAYIGITGTKAWLVNNKFHREDGPARIGEEDNYDRYYLDDIEYTKEDWEEEIIKRKLHRIKDL